MTNILYAVYKVKTKLNVRNPRIYLTILMPSGKQNVGNWIKLILEALGERYFSVRNALKV